MMRPALSEFSNSTLQFLDSLHSIATPLLVLLGEEKKVRPVQSFFQRTTSSSVLCASWRSIMSNLELLKFGKSFFFCYCLEDLEHLAKQFLIWTY